MTGTKYLSELVDVSLLQQDKLNIIKAPTGSGKTYFALQTIPGLVRDAVHKVVYLIDTVNGKDQIVENYNAIKEYRGWSKDIDGGGIWFYEKNDIVVITYARFGYILERYPEFYKEFTYIICDELHSLLRFQDFSPRPNCHSEAREGLEKAVKNSSATVIALTATPSTIPEKFHAPYIEIPIGYGSGRSIQRLEIRKRQADPLRERLPFFVVSGTGGNTVSRTNPSFGDYFGHTISLLERVE